MSKPLTSWVVWSFSLTVAGSAFAQAAGTGSGSVAVSSTEGATSDASASAAAPSDAAASDAAAPPKSEAAKSEPFEPYEEGLPPEGNVLELGIFGGVIFPSSDHNLRYQAYPQQPYSTGAELGARIGYYPASFLGLEGEGMAAASKVKDTETSAALYALRGSLVLQAPLPYVAPFILGGFGTLGAISRTMAHDADPAWHFGIGAKFPLTHLLSARLDLRDTLTKNVQQDGQAQTFEVLLGLFTTVERSRKEPPPPPPDTDHDGYVDSEDQCPAEAGVAPRGCPADPDTDKDGVPLPCDQCPKEVGVKPDGCPIRDKDGDGIFDDKDKCVDKPETKNGFEDEDGCPDNVPDAVKKFSGVIEGIYFDKNKATVTAKSKPVLANAAKVLVSYPSIKLEISGHTSSEGDAAVNQRLSQERADAVKQWLVDNGVPPERLKTRGAGPDEPIADNKKPAGREKNRRIEFKVLQ